MLRALGEGVRFLFHTDYRLYNDRYLFLFYFKFGFSKDKSWIDPVIILACQKIEHKINIPKVWVPSWPILQR